MRVHLPGPRYRCVACSGEDDWARGGCRLTPCPSLRVLGQEGSDSARPADGCGEGAWPGGEGGGLYLHSTLMLGPQVSCLPSLSLTFLLCIMGPAEF